MAENKRQWNKPSMHRVPVFGDKSLDEVATLPDDQLQEYLNENGFWDAAIVYHASPDFVLREIAGEIVLVPLNSAAQKISGMISLTETGSFLWKRLEQQPQTKEELAVALVAEYGITQDVARADASAFVDKAVASSMVAAS